MESGFETHVTRLFHSFSSQIIHIRLYEEYSMVSTSGNLGLGGYGVSVCVLVSGIVSVAHSGYWNWYMRCCPTKPTVIRDRPIYTYDIPVGFPPGVTSRERIVTRGHSVCGYYSGLRSLFFRLAVTIQLFHSCCYELFNYLISC